ncbi:unnamed protein product [Prorocentrum cordatum]|uniref:Major facilitator superfamily (MFS) profile domain-containing protein n=1 Tax=Prorocentrum cordatum TaxID=2364126 RepID=A0ABN9VY28_9DINO|nr:unnamed protein product [Polarella glacialis]
MAAAARPGRRLDDVIDDIGYGRAQHSILLYGGGKSVLSGGVVLMLNVAANSISSEYSLQNMERGALVSCVFVGNMFGNIFSGYVADLWGRRPPLLLACMLMTVATLASTAVAGFWWMIFEVTGSFWRTPSRAERFRSAIRARSGHRLCRNCALRLLISLRVQPSRAKQARSSRTTCRTVECNQYARTGH